jgi:hypothetical protein
MDLPLTPFSAHSNRKGTAVAVYDAAGELIAHLYASASEDGAPDLEPASALARLLVAAPALRAACEAALIEFCARPEGPRADMVIPRLRAALAGL